MTTTTAKLPLEDMEIIDKACALLEIQNALLQTHNQVELFSSEVMDPLPLSDQAMCGLQELVRDTTKDLVKIIRKP